MVPSSERPYGRSGRSTRLTAIGSPTKGRDPGGIKEELFRAAIDDARRAVPAAPWDRVRFLDWADSTVHLEADDGVEAGRFGGRARAALEAALAKVAGAEVHVRLHGAAPAPSRRRWRAPRGGASLADFIVDESNRAAHRFLLTYRSGRALFDPCVFHGPARSGKTHLLRAFSHRCRADDAGRQVRYLTAAGFGRGYRASLHGGRLDGFRREIDTPELLLVDGLEAIGNEPGTQREFARALERRSRAGGATVVAARVLPTEVEGLNPALASRLMAGLVVKIGPVRTEAVARAVKTRLLKRGVRVGGAVLERAAMLAAGAPTVAESIVLRAIADHEPPVTPDDLAPPRDEGPTTPSLDSARIRRVATRIASAYGVTVDDLESPRKHRRAQRPRTLLALVLRERFSLTAAEIGRNLGDRSVSTVTKMLRRAREATAADPSIAEAVADWIRTA